jgi:hypothetical protein
MYVLTAS